MLLVAAEVEPRPVRNREDAMSQPTTKAGEVGVVSFVPGFGTFTTYPNAADPETNAIQVTPMDGSVFTWDNEAVDAPTAMARLHAFRPTDEAVFVRFTAHLENRYIGCRSVDFATK